jgi:choline dehydrogenase-like flavoprotein
LAFSATASADLLSAIRDEEDMFLDARTLPNGIELNADICIIGGGAAGITLALALAGEGNRICLIESGGFRRDPAVQQLYNGKNASALFENGGDSFQDYLTSSRSRFLGGSSNRWGGWCRPYDEIDFERRAWVPHSGWPIRRDQLDPYYERAHDILRLGPFEYSPSFWQGVINRPEFRIFPVTGDDIKTAVSQFSLPVRFGRHYRQELASAEDLSALLYANVVDIELAHDVQSVKKVHISTLTGARFAMAARYFVLATGGIENARLLLASNRQCSRGIGNDHDLVGRYFMEHINVPAGMLKFYGACRPSRSYDCGHFYKNRKMWACGTSAATHLVTTARAQERYGLLNSRMNIQSIQRGEEAAGVQSLRNAYRWYGCIHKHRLPHAADLALIARDIADVARTAYAKLFKSDRFVVAHRLRHVVEPCPDPDNRVTLGAETDRFGLPKVTLGFRYGEAERMTMLHAQRLLDRAMRDADLGEVEISVPAQHLPDESQWVWHHMGTTRMADDPTQGVVDRTCRVHGISNLYVAGSSVFPTGGSDAPTMTVVALALRIADELRRQLSDLPRATGLAQQTRACVRKARRANRRR